jgi:peptide/nickel transport system permease protein
MKHEQMKTWWVKPVVIVALLAMVMMLYPVVFSVKPVYLWTDQLIFLLVGMVIFLVAYLRRKPHLLTPWRKVFSRRIAMSAAIILLAYVFIGLLDSVHFREPLPGFGKGKVQYSVEVTSMLDVALNQIRKKVEKTYSAPFATHLYSKENLETPDGRTIRDYPRLKYGGAHLKNPEKELAGDIGKSFLNAVFKGVYFWFLLVILTIAPFIWIKRLCFKSTLFSLLTGKTVMPWHVALYTLLVVSILFSIVMVVGPKYHILGTDKVGQDVLYLSLKSIRTGLVIGTLTTLVMLPFAVMLGVAAGYFRGWVDDVIQYLYTTLNSIPGVLLIAAAILSIQVFIVNHQDLFETAIDRADLRLLALCFILGVTSWTGLCRLLRGETLKLRELEYIQASNAFGVSHFRIIARHIVPNVMHIVLIVIVLDFSGLVLAEAVLSYIQVGVDPSTNSWGNMINGARLEMAREPMVWWSLLAAFCFMFVLVLAANLFSDAVRDAFDPRLRAD